MPFFTLPDLGEGLQEAEVVEWHVQEGDSVKVDAPLLSVETAKAIVDIPAPRDGTVATRFVASGDLVHIGEPLMAFAGDDADDSQTVVGKLDSEGDTDAEDHFIVGAVGSQDANGATTPAIRALARHLRVDLGQLKGKGPGGTITLDEVQQASRLRISRNDGASRDGKPLGGKPLKGVARSMAINLAAAGREAVPASLFDQVSIDHWPKPTDITIRLIHALVAGCQAEPGANAWFDGSNLSLRRIRRIDLGVAVNTPDGLFVPVLRDVANRSDGDLREGLDRLRHDVENRQIPSEELRGATLSLSNFGPLGGHFATPVVVPPQVVIVGVGRSFSQPAIRSGKLVDDRQMPVSLTFDHRALNGGQAARFLEAMLTDLAL